MNLLRLLIVDDNVSIRRLMHCLFESTDIQIIGEADNGRTAIRLAEQLQPDLILMDYQMPLMNGLDAARSILAHPHPPIILFFTSDDNALLLHHLHEIGVWGVLRKGESFESIYEALLNAGACAQAQRGIAA